MASTVVHERRAHLVHVGGHYGVAIDEQGVTHYISIDDLGVVRRPHWPEEPEAITIEYRAGDWGGRWMVRR